MHDHCFRFGWIHLPVDLSNMVSCPLRVDSRTAVKDLVFLCGRQLNLLNKRVTCNLSQSLTFSSLIPLALLVDSFPFHILTFNFLIKNIKFL